MSKQIKGVGFNKLFDPVCPSCHLVPIIFDHENNPKCQYCGTQLKLLPTQQKDTGKELEKTLIKIIYPNHGGEIPDWGDVQSHELNDILKLFKQRETHNEGR